MSFSVATAVAVSSRDPAGVVAGDFNQDGHGDLVVTSRGVPGANVRLLAGNGAGELSQSRSFAFGDASAVAAADFNGDGALDLAVTQDLATKGGGYVDQVCGSVVGLAILFGPDLSWAVCLATMPRAVTIQAGDFDEDGRPDIAVASAVGQGLRIYNRLNFLNFTWNVATVAGSAVQATRLAPPTDLNGDGTLDLVLAHSAGISTFLGSGDGTFAIGPAAGNTARRTVAVGDFNEDLAPDIASVEASEPGALIVSFGATDGTFVSQTIAALGLDLADVAVADVDVDGRADIVAGDAGTSAIRIFFGTGSGTFVENPALSPTVSPRRLAAGDWDEDGDIDLAIVDDAIPGQGSLARIALQDGSGPADATPPTVSLTLPDAGRMVAGTIAVTAAARDNVNVTRVEFLHDGVLVAQSAGPIFTARWNTTAHPDGSAVLAARAFDARGNYADSAVTVMIDNVDTEPPLVTAPAAMSAQATSPAGVAVSYAVTATDDRDGALTPACEPTSGATFPVGLTTVTCAATDRSGNTGTAVFTVTVALVVPARMTALAVTPTSAVPYGTGVTWTAAATGGVAPLQYEFWRYCYAAPGWVRVQPYGASASYTWTPGARDIGMCYVHARVRSAGSPVQHESYRDAPGLLVTGPIPVKVISLTADRPLPTAAGREIVWTAVGTGGTAALEYEFWRHNATTRAWSLVQTYGPDASFRWTPAAGEAGVYALHVRARSQGATTPFESYFDAAPFAITSAAPASISSVSVSPASPQAFGTPITWIAQGTGGSGSLEYEFWRYCSATPGWERVQAYGVAGSYTWTPPSTQIGTCYIHVRVRTVGSSAPYENYFDAAGFRVTNPVPLVLTSLTATPALPVQAGTLVTWTATADPPGTYEYQFWRYSKAAGVWTMVRDYAAMSTYSWAPTAVDAGIFALHARVRRAGSALAYEHYIDTRSFAITATVPARLLSLLPTPASPVPAGTIVTLTANGAASADPLEYQFWVYDLTANRWTVIQDYSTSATAHWTATGAGSYQLQVNVRVQGSPLAFEDYLRSATFIVNP